MGRDVRHLVRSWPADDATSAWLCRPRSDVVLEEPVDEHESQTPGPRVFRQSSGPFIVYERCIELVETDPKSSSRTWRESTSFVLDVPWFGWMVSGLLARHLKARSPGPDALRQPAWLPPDRLDERQVRVLGLLAAVSLLTAFVNTLFTQTVAFAGADLGVGDWGRGVAGTVVRIGIVLGLPAAILADRIGRRQVVVVLAWAAPVLASLGAIAPNFPLLVATQTLSRPLGLALDLLVAVIAAEEMPRSSRAYAVSILAMANGLGAGVAVAALPMADIGPGGWRLVYALSLIWLFVAVDITRNLPETHRFARVGHRRQTRSLEHRLSRSDRRRRLATQISVAFFGNMLLSPASFFQNSYLKDERGFSAGMVSLFTAITAAPAVIGLVAGGRAADRRGRRVIAAVCTPLGGLLIALSFATSSTWMWSTAILGSIVAAAAYPSLAVYRTEMFATGRRGVSGFTILASALIGGSMSLLLTGALADSGVDYGPIMLALTAGPLAVAFIVLFTYPETAHRELEDINPEDADPAP